MRLFLRSSLFLLIFWQLNAFAQTPPASAAKPVDATPPNIVMTNEDEQAPQITIRKRDGASVEEYRLNGRLYRVKVTPDNGAPPYFLVDKTGEGKLVPHDGPGEHGFSLPTWILGTF